jgi:hypothetical protein
VTRTRAGAALRLATNARQRPRWTGHPSIPVSQRSIFPRLTQWSRVEVPTAAMRFGAHALTTTSAPTGTSIRTALNAGARTMSGKLTLAFPAGRTTVLCTGGGAVASSIAASNSSPIGTHNYDCQRRQVPADALDAHRATSYPAPRARDTNSYEDGPGRLLTLLQISGFSAVRTAPGPAPGAHVLHVLSPGRGRPRSSGRPRGSR